MANPNINQRLNGLEPLSYAGVNAVQPPDFLTKPRDPTPNDSKNVYLGTIWLNIATETVWMLVSLVGNVATWVMLTGASGAVLELTGNSGGAVPPTAGNINVVGDGVGITITGNPGTSTLTASLVGGGVAAQSFPTDSGTATPIAGVLNIKAQTASLRCGSSVEFEGSTNNVNLLVTDADLNTIIGDNSGNLTLTSTNCTVLGAFSAPALTSSSNNTIIGEGCATLLAGGAGNNTIIGQGAATSLVSGSESILIGHLAGSSLTGSESNNTIIGTTGVAGSSGLIQLAIGSNASTNKIILHNYPGSAAINGSNIFLGEGAGNFTISSTSTVGNIGIGGGVLASINNGVGGNISIGDVGMNFLTSGVQNTGVGKDNFTSAGSGTGLVTGSYNTALGFAAGSAYTSNESSNILIGPSTTGVTGESNVTRIGNTTGSGVGETNKTFIHGIRGITTVNNNAIAVLIDSAGQLGTVSSSRTKKDNIVDMGSYSDVIRSLRPVVFNYKAHASEDKSVGLIAEEVAEVAPHLVVYKDGEPETVKYHDLVPMLLNEFQKHCQLIGELQAINTDLLNRIRMLEEKLMH
ncbi:MAG TPA: tail fiber domain-containing protein [Cyclobacteriaceae bacterium]|jgi:hypothetical protein|nr:tail fiber domain-containing protein [Cyclobacteriaceae bacterium]